MLEPNEYTRDWLHKRRQLLANTIACLIVLLILLGIMAFSNGCGLIHVKGNTRSVTTIEQVMTWNAALAEANLAIAKGVIAANEAGEIDVPASNAILTQQSLIADADRQLTPILAKACSPQKQIQACNSAILSGDGDAIETFVDQIRASASNLIKTGTAGIKNPTRKQTVDQAIQAIYTLIDKVIGGLQQLGVLKVKATQMVCQMLPDGTPISLSSETMVCAMGTITFTEVKR